MTVSDPDAPPSATGRGTVRRGLFSRSRLDALADGIFAFAMTLLVLDIQLPDDLRIGSAAELTAHLSSLWHHFYVYAMSFFVLGAFWRSSAQMRETSEAASESVVHIVLLFLFFVTAVPFSSGVVGRFAMAPAVMLYAGNMIVLAALAVVIRYRDVAPRYRSFRAAAGDRMPLFIVSALVSVAISLVAPGSAMLAYLLNLLPHLPFWPSGEQRGDAWGKK